MSAATAHKPVNLRIPRHVAIIMDGNGRWADQRNLPRIQGHSRGGENILTVLRAARDTGVEYLTLYAFSVENWQRPQDEVDALMHLLESYIARYFDQLVEERVRLRVIGNIAALPDHARLPLEKAIRETASFTGQTLVLALSYGARSEVVNAVQNYVREVQAGRADPAKLDWTTFAGYLDTAGIPDPDLIIRTSGEMRLSNFLLLQAAYAEWYFPLVLWPDFGREHFEEAIRDFGNRQRRFGKTGWQVADDPLPGKE